MTEVWRKKRRGWWARGGSCTVVAGAGGGEKTLVLVARGLEADARHHVEEEAGKDDADQAALSILCGEHVVRDPLSGACFLAKRMREASSLPRNKAEKGVCVKREGIYGLTMKINESAELLASRGPTRMWSAVLLEACRNEGERLRSEADFDR